MSFISLKQQKHNWHNFYHEKLHTLRIRQTVKIGDQSEKNRYQETIIMKFLINPKFNNLFTKLQKLPTLPQKKQNQEICLETCLILLKLFMSTQNFQACVYSFEIKIFSSLTCQKFLCKFGMEPGNWYVYLKSSPGTPISSQVYHKCYIPLQDGLLPTLTLQQSTKLLKLFL